MLNFFNIFIVREKARFIVSLIDDPKKLKEERKKYEGWKGRIEGVGSGSVSSSNYSSSSYGGDMALTPLNIIVGEIQKKVKKKKKVNRMKKMRKILVKKRILVKKKLKKKKKNLRKKKNPRKKKKNQGIKKSQIIKKNQNISIIKLLELKIKDQFKKKLKISKIIIKKILIFLISPTLQMIIM